jgi:hypothetical protein
MGATCEPARVVTSREYLEALGSLVCDLTSLQLIAERDRLNKDLENAHSAIKGLEVCYPLT